LNKHLVVIVGTGFSGLAAAYELKKRGMHDFVILDRNDQAGGCWRENKYPGVECDVHSHLYSYSYFPNRWSRVWAGGDEIHRYLLDFSEWAGLDRHIRYGVQVKSADFGDDNVWRIKTNGRKYECKYFISAVGQQNTPSIPEIEGLENFKGNMMHTARWDHDVDLSGRVAVIGSAASAVQIVPQLAKSARHLCVFQRSPNWIFPKPNRDYTEEEKKQDSKKLRAEIRKFWDSRWKRSILGSRRLKKDQKRAQKSMESQVGDNSLRAKLIPTYPLGVKRVLISNDYLKTFLRSNVALVTEPIQSVGEHSIFADGERPFDTIIFATGFKSLQFLSTIEVSGKAGQLLRRVWKNWEESEAYLGTYIHGFPNMFMLYGPNSGVGSSSVILMIEAQAKMIGDTIDYAERNQIESVEVRYSVQKALNKSIMKLMKKLVWSSNEATSWFKTRAGRVTTKWPFTTREFEKKARFKPGDFILIRRD